MVQVRVTKVFKPDWQRYVGRTGEITGVIGQYVKVQSSDDKHLHLFLPMELIDAKP